MHDPGTRMETCPRIPLHQFAVQSGVSKSSACKAKKLLQLHQHKNTVQQQLLSQVQENNHQSQHSSYVGFIVIHILVHTQSHHDDGSVHEPERVAQ